MNKILKKFLAVFIATMMMFTSTGFADLEISSVQAEIMQDMISQENSNEDKGVFDSLETEVTTGSAQKIELIEPIIEENELLLKKEKKEAIFVIERATLGQAFYMEPTVVEFNEGDNVASVVVKLLGEDNYKCTGSPASSFYLSKVKLNDSLPVSIPEHIIDMGVDSSSIEENKDEWLGEFDHTSMSGWMYWQNHSMPNVGMSDAELKNDDVIRLQFTVYGYGQDLGIGFGGESSYPMANKDDLVRTLAYVNEDKSVLDSDETLKAAYDKGVELMMNMTATQDVVDKAVADIKNPPVEETDKSKLSSAISQAEKINKETYTSGSAAVFEDSFASAKAINEKTGAKQSDIDAAIKNLKNSIMNLEKEDIEAQWPLFRGNEENHGLVSSELPVPGDDIETKWIQKYGSGWSGNGMSSILVDDSIYIVGSNKLQKRSLMDGSLVKETSVPKGIDFYSNLGYGNGNIYVPSSKGTINAFDAKTLDFMWTSESAGNFQNLSAIQYDDGIVYAGFTSGGTSGGVFVAFNGATGEVEWKYGEGTSYYQTGAVIFGDSVLFAGDDGKLVSANSRTGEEIDTLDLGGGVRCIPVKHDGHVYLTSKSGYVYKIEVNSDGSFGEELSYKAGTQGTTSPVMYNGRVYAGFGGMGTGGKVAVLNDADMSLVYEAALPGPTQSSPILTTAYATEKNNNKVYLYFALNNANGTIVCVEDDENNTEPKVTNLYQPDPKQYSMASPIAGTDGTIYYTNDSGNIFALAKKDKGVEINKSLLAEKISQAEKIKKDLYTEDSLTILEEALANAKKSNENTNIIQLEVDKAANELATAIVNLELKKEEKLSDYKIALNSTLESIYKNTPDPGIGTMGGEWSVISLSRGGYPYSKEYIAKYYNNVLKEVTDKKGRLDERKYTEYSRVILGLTSIGKDVTAVGNYNLLENMGDYDKVIWQGINGPIWALIAIDSNSYIIPEKTAGQTQTTREKLIDAIISKEITKNGVTGGFALMGSKPDPDITAMAIQALAPYQKEKKIGEVIERSLNTLSGIQRDDGQFVSYNNPNSQSTAQVIVALSALGIDSKKDVRFIKNGTNPIDALMIYYVEDGGFKNVIEDSSANAMASDQAAYALVAYDRLISGKTSLYDMSDVEFNVDKSILEEQMKEAKSKEVSQYTSATWKQMDKTLKATEKVNADPTSKQADVDGAVAKLKEAVNNLKEKLTERPSIETGNVNIPENSENNYEMTVPSNKKLEVTIPENTESKVTIKVGIRKAISKFQASKGKNSIEIPEGIVIIQGSGDIQLFGTKTEEEKSEMQNDVKDILVKTDDKLKAVKVEEAFKFGDTDSMVFDGYVDLTFAGMAGKGAAYIDNSGIHIIPRVTNDAQGLGNDEYALDSGSDLIIKTKHFTDFITYSLEREAEKPSDGGTSGPDNTTKEKIVTISVDKKTISKGYVIEPIQIKIKTGDNVWTVLKKEMDNRGISYRYENNSKYGSVYVQAIDGDGEFDHGKYSGWMYNVNGVYPGFGSDKYILNGGETIEWRYTTNLGEDLGQDNSSWGAPAGGGAAAAKEEGTSLLKPETTVTNGEAKAEIEDKFIKGMISEVISKKLNQIVIEPKVDSKAKLNKITIVLEKESISKISSQTKAVLKLKTQLADIKLSNKALAGLAKEKGNTVTISVIANKDGSIGFEIKAGLDTVSKIASGITVSIPVEKPSSSTVAVQMMPDGTEKILMKSVTEGKYLNVKLDGSATVKIRENKKTYADTANHWAKDAIEFASAREILKGTSADNFSPNATMTKGMLVTLLHRFENEELVQGKAYDDVKSDAYYANAAAWAQVKGIAEGETDTKFLPNQEVTREQLASMIYNYAKLSGEDVSSTNEDKIKTFEDWNETSKESQEAMKYCYNNNIIGGKSDTTLDPQGKTTRAEVSAIIQRYVSKTTI